MEQPRITFTWGCTVYIHEAYDFHDFPFFLTLSSLLFHLYSTIIARHCKAVESNERHYGTHKALGRGHYGWENG